MCRISCCMIFLFLLPLPLSLSLFHCLLLCFYLLNCVVKNRSRPEPQRRLCARWLCVCLCICVRVCLLFWVFLLGFVFGFILVAQFRLLAALFGGLEAKTKDILIKMLTVSLSLPLSLSLSFPLSLSLSLFLHLLLSPLNSRPQFDCLPHCLNPLMPLWF